MPLTLRHDHLTHGGHPEKRSRSIVRWLCYTWKVSISFPLMTFHLVDIIEHPILTKRPTPSPRSNGSRENYSLGHRIYSKKVFGKIEAVAITSLGEKSIWALDDFCQQTWRGSQAVGRAAPRMPSYSQKERRGRLKLGRLAGGLFRVGLLSPELWLMSWVQKKGAGELGVTAV